MQFFPTYFKVRLPIFTTIWHISMNKYLMTRKHWTIIINCNVLEKNNLRVFYIFFSTIFIDDLLLSIYFSSNIYWMSINLNVLTLTHFFTLSIHKKVWKNIANIVTLSVNNGYEHFMLIIACWFFKTTKQTIFV